MAREFKGELRTLQLVPLGLNRRLAKLSTRLFRAYCAQHLLGRGVSNGLIVEIPIYGAPQRFSLSFESSLEGLSLEDSQWLITHNVPSVITIGGLSKQLPIIENLVRSTLLDSELYSTLNIPPPKGLLLYGPPGTGKTLIVKHLVATLQVALIPLSNTIFSKFVGEAEAKVHEIFEEARNSRPAVLFIDEIDSICPKRGTGLEEYQTRIVTSILSELDSLENNSQVLLIATTNRPNVLEPALRRPGRIDKELEIPVPPYTDRLDILNKTLKSIPNELTAQNAQFIAQQTHGFVGADIVNLCREAALKVITEYQARKRTALCLQFTDLASAMNEVAPSALRGLIVEIPKVLWSDIGGYAEAKLAIKQAVEWPLKHPEAFKRLGISYPKGILLYGPPGCSKTMLAKAIATETALNFIPIKGPELFSRYVGDSEQALREVFRKARGASPCVIFIDELDALGGTRQEEDTGVNGRVLCTLLNEMDGIEVLNDVIVLAATNRPELIDKALIRPGRIDRLIYISLPDQLARVSILEINTRQMPLEGVDLAEIAAKCEGFTGAEVTLVPREAGLFALTEDLAAARVGLRHFQMALVKVRPRVGMGLIQQYREFEAAH